MLHFTEVNACWRKSDVVALSIPLAAEFKLVPPLCGNFEVGTGDSVGDLRSILNGDSHCLAGQELCRSHTQSERLVFAVIWNLFNCKVGRNLRGVSDVDLLSCGLAHKEQAEIEVLLVGSDERVFADRLQLYWVCLRVVTLFKFHWKNADQHFCTVTFVGNFDVLPLLWGKRACFKVNKIVTVIIFRFKLYSMPNDLPVWEPRVKSGSADASVYRIVLWVGL